MGKEILVIDDSKKLGRPRFEFTPKVLEQIEKLASVMCTLSEIGDIIGCSHDTIQRNQEAKEAIKRGVANAKNTIRKTQFDIATKLNSSIMAMWLGKVYLGQTDKIQNTDDNVPLPIYDIIEHEEPKEVIELKEIADGK
jgi:TctA family transporter